MAGKLTCNNIEVKQADSIPGGAIVGPNGAANTWNTGISGVAYRKFPDGMVEAKLTAPLIATGTVGPLPNGFRPAANQNQVVGGSTIDTYTMLVAMTTGHLQNASASVEAGNGAFIRFYSDGS